MTSSPEVQALCASDERLSLLIEHYGSLSYSLHTDVFSFFIETIIGQMLSNKAADAIAACMYKLCGGELTGEAVLKLDTTALKNIGLSGQKADYILGFASLMDKQPDYFKDLTEAPDEEVIKCLTSSRGIGAWTSKMYLIFVLNRLDVLPYEDGAFLQVYKWLYGTDDIKPPSIKQKCAPWKPYSSIATRYFYRALDQGLMQDASLSEKRRLKNSTPKKSPRKRAKFPAFLRGGLRSQYFILHKRHALLCYNL